MGLLSLALILDWLIGDPDWLWKRIPHPVVLIGKLIDRWDNGRETKGADPNTDRKDYWSGVALVSALLALSVAIAGAVMLLTALSRPLGLSVELVAVVSLLAQRSLFDHVSCVASALRSGGVGTGRKVVGMIVGRDVSTLDESAISKAAIESLAENFSDGIVAPAFWYVVGGLPGLIFYKAINTADSMIGHRTPRHEFFGKPAALLDDLLNWLPSRLSVALAGCASQFFWFRPFCTMIDIVRRDAPQHRSPNAGWPETAFAYALDLSLGGPRAYGEAQVDGAVLHSDGRSTANIHDIERATRLMAAACIVLFGTIFGLWLLIV